jgi:hypothetical protein
MSDSEELPFDESDDEVEHVDEDQRVVDLGDGLPPLPYDGTRYGCYWMGVIGLKMYKVFCLIVEVVEDKVLWKSLKVCFQLPGTIILGKTKSMFVSSSSSKSIFSFGIKSRRGKVNTL